MRVSSNFEGNDINILSLKSVKIVTLSADKTTPETACWKQKDDCVGWVTTLRACYMWKTVKHTLGLHCMHDEEVVEVIHASPAGIRSEEISN